MTTLRYQRMLKASLLATTLLTAPHLVRAAENTLIDGNNGTLPLPTGQYVTPTASLTNAIQQPLNPGLPSYPNFVAGEAVRSRLSPDGTTLAIICAGQNSLNDATGTSDKANSTQYIFLYNVADGNKTSPQLMQVIKQANSHIGLVWSPDGNTLYGAGGNDDAVYVYTKTNGAWSQSAKIALGHSSTHTTAGVGLGVEPNASGLGISVDGKTLVVANNYNDSISVIDTATNTVRYEHDLRPYFANNEGTSGVPGGEYPLGVVIKGNGIAYVSSYRDREVVVVDISSPTAGHLITRIKLDGNGNEMTMDAAQATLFVAQENADQVAVIDTASNKVTAKIDARAPAGVLTGPKYTGAATFAVTVSPDGKTLYAVNDGANSIAVIPLSGANANTVTGLIPTAYAPKDITFSADGTWMYIINGKSDTGPNPGNLLGNTALITNKIYPGGNTAAAAARASNQYQFQLEHATLVSAQTPGSGDLPAMTAAVEKNNLYNVPANTSDESVMKFLHEKVQHVIYIVKENRTFDQMLGDLTNGADADPSLTQFGKSITPNFHRIATNFVTLDNFMDPGDGSMDGWSWTMRGRVTSTEEVTQQINYAGVDRGLSYESEGSNRNTPIGLASTADRDAATKGAFTTASANLPGGTANLLPGTADVAATDSPFGEQQGHIFDAVLKAGLTVRNYGWQTNNIGPTTYSNGAPIENPGESGVVQVAELNPTLVPFTDVYFRGFDMTYSDQWTVNEWNREFMQYIANNNLPSFEMMRLSHDHTGSFSTALSGVNTPDTQEADNDLAVGRVLEAVAHSPYANNTVIIVTEDDCQDGPDHVDSHRSTTYIAGAYVRKHTIVSTRYNQVSVMRTIEDILGAPHVNLNDAYQRPMTDVFDTGLSGAWTYNAVASTILKTTTLALADIGVKYADGPDVLPRHDAAYWAKATRGFDFSGEDRIPFDLMNEVLWEGEMGGTPYPTHRSGMLKVVQK